MSTKGVLFQCNELRAQVAEAVRARRMRKANTRTNQKYLKCPEQLENFLEQERRHNLEHPLQYLRRRKGNSQTGKGN
jgi:hypothetical protein